MSIYLDHAATTPMIEPAINAMESALRKIGNPSSLHTDGRATRKDVEEAREVIAQSLGCQASEVIFTGSGTEANNTAIKGLFWSAPDKNLIVVSAIEHHAVLDPAHWLVEHEGAELIEIPVKETGVIDCEFLRDLVSRRGDEIALISVMSANNETGVIQPIEKVVEIAGSIPVHTDAVQSYMKFPLNFSSLGLFAMTVSAHKIGGPLGIGALILRKAFEMPALLHGGGQEREIRSGTLNAPSIVAFAAAVSQNAFSAQSVEILREKFEDGIGTVAPHARINGKDSLRLPGISNVTFPGTQADFLLLLMDGKKVSCSTGAACTAGVHRPSHVLMAMGHDEIGATSSLRFSLGANTTAEDIDYVLGVIPEVIDMAKAANSL
jgi:cysteine desulfurase